MTSRLQPVLALLRVADTYLPPGLDPRRRPGPPRPRRSGTDVEFPRVGGHPSFLVSLAETSFDVTGNDAVTGAYHIRIEGLTNQPVLAGVPMRARATRADGADSPRGIDAAVLLGHHLAPVSDSIRVALDGITLPSVELTALGTRVSLGEGRTTLAFARRGDTITGRITISTTQATWTPPTTPTGDDAVQRVRDVLWRALSRVRDIDIVAEIGGTLERPRITISSNVGRLVAQNLQRELGREIERAQQQARQAVDGVIDPAIRDVERGITSTRISLTTEIDALDQALSTARADLEKALTELSRGLIPGLRRPLTSVR